MQCNKRLLPEIEGQKEVCEGGYHYYVKNMKIRKNIIPVRVGDEMLKCPVTWGASMEGILHKNFIDEQKENKKDDFFLSDKKQTFDIIRPDKNLTETDLKAVKRFLSDKTYRKLIISGKTGRGKTLLAYSIKNYYSGKPEKCLMISSRNLNGLFRDLNTYNPDPESHDFMRMIENSDIFIIDDLGSEYSTELKIMELELKEFIDTYPGRLVITSNHGKREILTHYGDKIYSRFQEKSIWIMISGDDYRMKK